MYVEPPQYSKIELFVTLVNGIQLLTNATKNFTLDRLIMQLTFFIHDYGKKYVAGNKLRSAVKRYDTLITFQALACYKSPALVAIIIFIEFLKF